MILVNIYFFFKNKIPISKPFFKWRHVWVVYDSILRRKKYMFKYNNRITESNFTFGGTTFSVLTAISLWAKRFLRGTLSWRTSSITYAYLLFCLRNWMQLHVFVLRSKCIFNTNQTMEINNTSLTCEPKFRTPKIISSLMALSTKYLSWSSWF